MSTPSTSSTQSNTNQLVLSDLTLEFSDFVDQFQTFLNNTSTWNGNLTIKTSATLIQLVGSVGTFMMGRLTRAYEDAFPETAQSDDAVRSAVQMQGLRLSRYLPAGLTGNLTSPFDVTLPIFTQFTCGGAYFFNREPITLLGLQSTPVTLYQGTMVQYVMPGLGTDLQAFVSDEDDFVVSDQDVQVQVNGVTIPKTLGGLWNYDGLPAYADLTLPTGQLIVQFGNSGGVNGSFGTIPQTTDSVAITYPVTTGDAGNNLVTMSQPIAVVGFSTIVGQATANPTGGAPETSIQAYKNVASGGFGTYSSAVTKSQYLATLATYPGIVDVVTQAQREINPEDYRWMNVIRVSALTYSPWTQAQIKEFTDYCQTVTMYVPYFLYQNAVPVPRVVDVDVYCFNSADLTTIQQNVITGIQNLFAPRPGILMTDFFPSDIDQAAFNSSPNMISYVVVNTPTQPMIVTAPPSPVATYALIPGGGDLGASVYAYSVATTLIDGTVGPPSNWVFPQITGSVAAYSIELTWPAVYNAASYTVYGRLAGSLGLIATLPATTLTFTDNGTITPVPPLPSTLSELPIQYNTLASLTVNVYYAERQQRIDTTLPTRISS